MMSQNMDYFTDFYVLFIFFLFDESGHWKVVSYQFECAVHDEAGGYIIVMYFYTAMVNSKK